MIFEPDIFSNKTPVWNRIDCKQINLFKEICKFIPRLYISQITSVYYSGTFEINSNNYKIESLNGNSILLKKWPLGTDKIRVEKIQKLTNWLYKKKIPSAYAGSFTNKSLAFIFKGNVWSFNLFNDGDYFSGEQSELISVAKNTGKLARILFDLPTELSPKLGPQHLSDNDNLIINKMLSERNNLESYFGNKTANLINLHWDYIFTTWNNLYKKDLVCGPIVPCHFDMHPHNLIAQDGEIVAILDFDSCKKIPLGYSLAFNFLKQCRQFLSLDKKNTNYKEVKDIYLQNLISEITLEEVSKYDLLNLSKVEVMRRICYIFKLNLIDNDPKWNHVLSIQIAHLYESEKLFKN